MRHDRLTLLSDALNTDLVQIIGGRFDGKMGRWIGFDVEERKHIVEIAGNQYYERADKVGIPKKVLASIGWLDGRSCKLQKAS